MRICFVADARSPTARSWITYFVERGHDVRIISTYPVSSDSYSGATVMEVTSLTSRQAAPPSPEENRSVRIQQLMPSLVSKVRVGRFAEVALAIQHWVERSEVRRRSIAIQNIIRRIRPDVVHALRLPFEGIMAAIADPAAPLVLSTWGNDLTLFARRFAVTCRLIRRSLDRADALLADCQRDIILASQFGFAPQKPWLVIPGGGGVQLDLFGDAAMTPDVRACFSIPANAPLVCNPRGFRPGGVRNDTFFRAAALTTKARPDVIFAAVGMRGNAVAERWTASLGIEGSMRLLPTLSRAEMFALLKTSDIMVSPSEHDGTPNTLLESMTAGAFPICGDIESVREWITDGVNGKLRRASDPEGFAEAILSALADTALRASAAEKNRRIVQERAEYSSCMQRAEKLYENLLSRPEVPTGAFSGKPE